MSLKSVLGYKWGGFLAGAVKKTPVFVKNSSR
jgi:hypothetical protein